MLGILIQPLTLLSRNVLSPAPEFFSSIASVLMVFLLAFLLWKNRKTFELQFSSSFIFAKVLFFISQAIAILYSFLIFQAHDDNLFLSYLNFLLFLAYLAVIFLVLRMILSNERSFVQFFKGIYLSGGIMLLIVVLQLIYLKTGFLKVPVKFIMDVFGRNTFNYAPNTGDLLTGWKALNTLGHPIGLMMTGDGIASWFGLTVIPFALAAYKNRLYFPELRKMSGLVHAIVLVLIITALFLSGDGIAYLIAMITLILFISFIFARSGMSDGKTRLITYPVVGILILVMLFGETGFLGRGFMEHMNFLQTNVEMRANIEALWTTFIHHPIFGVGFQGSSNWNILNVPTHYIAQSSAVQHFMATNYFPPQVAILQAAAELGLILLVPVLGFGFRVKIDFTELVNRLKSSDASEGSKRFWATLNDALFFFWFYFVFISFTNFDWTNISDIMVTLFFIVAKNYLQKYVNRIAPIDWEGNIK